MSTFQQYLVSPWLTSVRLCSNINISGTYSNGPLNNGVGATLTIAASSLTVDSVVAAVGDRILLQNQTSAFQSGIYVVNSISTTVVLQRAADQQSIEQLRAGQYVTVAAGTALAGSAFALVESLPAILGVNTQSWVDASAVANIALPTILNHIAVYTNTAGALGEDATTAINGGNIQAGLDATAGTLASFPSTTISGKLVLAAVNNSSGNFNTTISNASAVAQSQVVSIPDGGSATSNFILSKTTGTQHITVGSLEVDAGNLIAGISGTAGFLQSFPASANGSLKIVAVANTGNTITTISNAAMGQASVVSIPDPAAATANFVLDAGNATSVSTLNLKYGATPVAQVDPGSCTITAAAGASNHCTITVQLKDGSGTNMARVIPFKVYLATDNTGLTLQSAASTGYSVTSGGVKDPTGNTTITQGLAVFSSATGGCVVDLLDTGKGTGNLILMLPNGFKASAAITAGSYGA